MTGPTEEGSIVAKVKADISNLEENITRAQVKIEELTGKKPEIKVDAKVAEALTKLEAVKAAEDRVTEANVRLTKATGDLETAETSSSRKASTILSARREATKALQEAQSAVDGLTLSQRALAKEEQDAADKAAKADSAGSGGRLSYMQGILIAVAALIPLLGPLTGYVAGVAGGLAGMGAAGVLAIVGIKNAMAQGTAAGNAFSGGLHELKGSLDQLGQTSAVAMLPYFQKALDQIRAAMPGLNTEIRLFSAQLGGVGNTVISILISGFKTLLPLFLQGGVYIQQLATSWLKWTTTGGLAKFAADASAALPVVGNALGALVKGVLDLIGALAPLGGVMLSVIQLVGTLASVLATVLQPPLVIIASGAAAVWGTFALWDKIGPTVTRGAMALVDFGIELVAVLGPVGAVSAAVLAVTVAMVGWNVVLEAQAAITKSAALYTQDYTTAIIADTGAVGANTKAHLAKALIDSGALKYAHELGISTETYTSAILGNQAAIDKVNNATKAQELGSKGLDSALKSTKLNLTDYNLAQLGAADGMKTNSRAIKEGMAAYQQSTQIVNTATDAETALAQRYGMSTSVYLAAKDAQKSAADQLAQTTANMYLQNDAGGLLQQTLDKLNGKTLSSAQAQNQFDSQIANMADHLDKTGKFVDRANTSLTGMTAAAVANRGELITLTQAAETNAQAYRDAGGGMADTKQKLIDMKTEIVANAVAHGENKDQVQQFVDTIFKIPDSIPPVKIDADTTAAMTKIAVLNSALAKLSKNEIIARSDFGSNTLGAKSVDSNGLPTGLGKADGGTVRGPGTATSDSILTPLSVSEEVIRASRAGAYRPMLKAINNGSPAQIQAAASNIAGPGIAGGHTFETTMIVAQNDQQGWYDFQRRMNSKW